MGLARVELRRFVSIQMWLGVGGALTWTHRDGVRFEGSLGLFRQLQ
jgi:hypothetical protein